MKKIGILFKFKAALLMAAFLLPAHQASSAGMGAAAVVTACYDTINAIAGTGQTINTSGITALAQYEQNQLTNYTVSKVIGLHEMYLDACAQVGGSLPASVIAIWNNPANTVSILTQAYQRVWGANPTPAEMDWMLNHDVVVYKAQFGGNSPNAQAIAVAAAIGGADFALGSQEDLNGSGSSPNIAAINKVVSLRPSGVTIGSGGYTSTNVNQLSIGINRVILPYNVVNDIVLQLNTGYLVPFGGSGGQNVPDASGFVPGSNSPSVEGNLINNYPAPQTMISGGVMGGTVWPGTITTAPAATVYSLSQSLKPYGSSGYANPTAATLTSWATSAATFLWANPTAPLVNVYVTLGVSSIIPGASPLSATFGAESITVFINTVYSAALGYSPSPGALSNFQNLYTTYKNLGYTDLQAKGAVLGTIQYYADTGGPVAAFKAALAQMDQAARGFGPWATLH